MSSMETGFENLSLLQAKAALDTRLSLPRAARSGPALPGAATAPTNGKTPTAADQKRWKASLDFQTMFLSQMYKSMRKTVDHGELTQPSFARDMFSEMLDNDIAGSQANSPIESGPLGLLAAQTGKSNSLAAAIYRSMQQSGQDGVPMNPGNIPSMSAPGSSAPPTLGQSELQPLVDEAATQYGLSPNLLRSVIHTESGDNPAAVSPKGAKGLMQLMDTTSADLGVTNPFDPRANVLAGARYLRGLLDRFGGNERKALAGYNAGPAAVDRFGDVPPFPETQNYVDRVMQFRDALNAQGGT